MQLSGLGFIGAQSHLRAGTDLTKNRVIIIVFKSLEWRYLLQEHRLPAKNVTITLRSLTLPSFEPLELSLDRDLTWKTCFLLALGSGNIVTQLHGLSCEGKHSSVWSLCMFLFVSEFVVKTQNPLVLDLHLD